MSNLVELATRTMKAFEDIEAIRTQLDVIGEKTNDNTALNMIVTADHAFDVVSVDLRALAHRLQSLADEEAAQQTKLIAQLQASLKEREER